MATEKTFRIIVVSRDERGRCEYRHMATVEADSMKTAILMAEASDSIGPKAIGGIFEIDFYFANKKAIDDFFAGERMSRKIAP